MSLLNILTKKEINVFESAPVFNYKEKNYYFNVEDCLLEKVDISNHIYFVILYGYFKATNQFFNKLENDENINYVFV